MKLIIHILFALAVTIPVGVFWIQIKPFFFNETKTLGAVMFVCFGPIALLYFDAWLGNQKWWRLICLYSAILISATDVLLMSTARDNNVIFIGMFSGIFGVIGVAIGAATRAFAYFKRKRSQPA